MNMLCCFLHLHDSQKIKQKCIFPLRMYMNNFICGNSHHTRWSFDLDLRLCNWLLQVQQYLPLLLLSSSQSFTCIPNQLWRILQPSREDLKDMWDRSAIKNLLAGRMTQLGNILGFPIVSYCDRSDAKLVNVN